jgi:hypothetical protein
MLGMLNDTKEEEPIVNVTTFEPLKAEPVKRKRTRKK